MSELPADETRPEAVVRFWLGDDSDDPRTVDAHRKYWFTKDPAFDRRVAEEFGTDVERASRGELDHWARSPRGALALVLVCDQFPRNIHRGTPRAFALDERALRTARALVAHGDDAALGYVERAFLYMPLMHAEDLDAQQLGVERFAALAGEAPSPLSKTMRNFHHYAERHMEIVQRFGRFPHRNAILGRESTPDEAEFLQQPGSSF